MRRRQSQCTKTRLHTPGAVERLDAVAVLPFPGTAFANATRPLQWRGRRLTQQSTRLCYALTGGISQTSTGLRHVRVLQGASGLACPTNAGSRESGGERV